MNDTLQNLLQALDERAAILSESEKYLAGKQPLAFMSTAARDSTKLSRMASNLPRLAVNSLAERLRVTDLKVDGKHDSELWADWRRNDLDQSLSLCFREALGLGTSYAVVWDSSGRAKPKVSIESAHQVAIDTDPGTRETLAAVKRWEADNATHAVLYLPDHIERWRADNSGAVAGFVLVETIRNPLGVVPVVAFRNGDRLLGPGESETLDLRPLVDALNKTLADLMVGSEFYARPRRWATGVEMQTDDDGKPVNPFPEGDRMLLSEDDEARFGQLPAADLHAYDSAVKILLGQICAVSALPEHYLGVFQSNPTSADAMRAAEASLSARAEAKQRQFGRSVEAVGRLMKGIATGVDPDSLDVSVAWSDPTTRSVAQEADAAVKLHAEGILPTDYVLSKLGYTAEEVAEIRRVRESEGVDKVLAALIEESSKPQPNLEVPHA